MNVIALCSYPAGAACTRFRLVQLAPELRRHGIELDVLPLLDERAFGELYVRGAWTRTVVRLTAAAIRRVGDAARARSADVLLVQREAMLFGPPIVEWSATLGVRVPLVLDLDDATWVSVASPTYGRVAQALKWPGKTDWLIRRAAVVTCGNGAIADHAESLGTATRLVPTVVDTDRYVPAARPVDDRDLVVGWIGSHSTYPYLASLLPVLASVAKKTPFRLLVVGAGQPVPPIDGVVVDARDWRLEREVADFQSLDIGLYPIIRDRWSIGKSGLKAIEYMAVGVPYIASPVGAVGEMGVAGVTHFPAETSEEWHDALTQLLGDRALRQRMGAAGRQHALDHYTVAEAASALAGALRFAAQGA